MKQIKYEAVLFDLLTALLDSWTVWAEVAGDDAVAQKWRMRYLELTYGQGAYRPYEELVALSAAETNLPLSYADALIAAWADIKPWDDVKEVLTELKEHMRMGVVTNCSEKLGRQAAAQCGVDFNVVVTSERAGFYKPDPAPYRLAIKELKAPPEKILYVSGSAFDIPGAMGEGMDVFWHNRIGMVMPEGIAAPLVTARTLTPLKAFIREV
jgi:2-haloalkanoic acid dehalogenase type II